MKTISINKAIREIEKWLPPVNISRSPFIRKDKAIQIIKDNIKETEEININDYCDWYLIQTNIITFKATCKDIYSSLNPCEIKYCS